MKAVRRLTSAEAVCSIPLRAERFTHPDTVMDDLAKTLEEIKSQVLASESKVRVEKAGSLDVVVVSRKSFELAVNTSPLQLPEWFPVSPEQVVNASVTDLTLRVAVPLSQVDTGELCRLLYELDRGLLRRIKAGLDADPKLVNRFLTECRDRTRGVASYQEVLVDVERKLYDVRNPRDYRPSRAGSCTLMGHIWHLANTKSANDLVKIAKSLACAAGMGAASVDDFPEALLTVLGRPRIRHADSRWAYNVIMSTQGACQLITAAAHADRYGRYPAWLLRSLSLDLRRSLDDAVRLLAS